MSNLQRVADWNKTAKRPQLDEPGLNLPEEILALRIKLLREEVTELETAYAEGNIVEALDALCDIQVVLNGGIAEAGLLDVFEAAMEAVCDSNDSKFMPDGSALLREGDNKIMKGPNYKPVDLVAVLRQFYPYSTAGEYEGGKKVYHQFTRSIDKSIGVTQ